MTQQTAYPPQFGYPTTVALPPRYGYQTPPAAPQSTGTNGMAIAALVISLHSFGLPGVSIVGAILGHVARHQIRRTGQDGDGVALAGIIIGWAITGLYLALVGFIIVAAVLAN